MSEFVSVAQVGAVPEGEGRAFSVAGRIVAVFLKDGKYHAVNDACPHMGASLATGWVDGLCVTCPWHAWRFSLENGSWLDNPKSPLKTDCYEVRVEGTAIQVRLVEGGGLKVEG